jgi:putative oxidoreductase
MLKKLFSTNIQNTFPAHIWLLILRICVAGFMLTHGLSKLTKLLDGNFAFADPIGIGAGPSLALAVFSEVICSFFILIGLGTRLATVPLSITMLVAAFIQHADDPFGKKEMALLYLLVYLTLMVFGGGKYSFDNLLLKRRK